MVLRPRDFDHFETNMQTGTPVLVLKKGGETPHIPCLASAGQLSPSPNIRLQLGQRAEVIYEVRSNKI